MKFVIQRVTEASVSVEGEVIGKIGKGFLVLIGVGESDTKEIADKLVKKLVGLRIFEDENGKTNLALKDVDRCCRFPSLRCMPTVKKAIAQVLRKRERRIRQMNFTNIL